MSIRALLVIAALLLAPQVARADYLDVISLKLTDKCDLEKYQTVVDEFRGVMTSQGYKYRVELAVPFATQDLSVLFWVGREPTFADFGAEYDRWTAAVAKGGTPEAKVNAKLVECQTQLSRTGSFTQ